MRKPSKQRLFWKNDYKKDWKKLSKTFTINKSKTLEKWSITLVKWWMQIMLYNTNMILVKH